MIGKLIIIATLIAMMILMYRRKNAQGSKDASLKDNYRKTPDGYPAHPDDCGPASLITILEFFGKLVPLDEMRAETDTREKIGCNALSLKHAAEHYGLECKAYRTKPDVLMTIETPCIIHLNNNYFVVFEGFRDGSFYINDPADGRKTISQGEMEERFSGVVLTFKKTDRFQPSWETSRD